MLPSHAFGDGSHPTTILCARALHTICRTSKPQSVLDIGTGTGVLARIARNEGASFVVATEIDPEAIIAAEKNVALDHHPVKIQFSDQPPDTWGPVFNLVVANILEPVLIELAPLIAQATAQGGQLMMSGFTPLQVPPIETAFQRHGFRLETHAQSGEWSLVLMQFGR